MPTGSACKASKKHKASKGRSSALYFFRLRQKSPYLLCIKLQSTACTAAEARRHLKKYDICAHFLT